MKKSHKLIPSLILTALLSGFATSCNESTDPDETIVVTPSTVAVSKFNLQSDSKVIANLDSVFFSIDLKKGVIFNADSLPKGTPVNKLVPVITFANAMTAAELVFTDNNGSQKTVNYLENKTDSIDFTNEVLLNVTAADGENKYSYRIKVNVHSQKPDSLMWDRISTTPLPSRKATPLRQKSVTKDNMVYTLIEETDHSLTLAQASNIANGYEKCEEISLPFNPAVESLTSTPDAFYMLDASGILHVSPDMAEWISTGEEWVSIVGPYLDSVLGIRSTDNGLMHCHYPASDLITDAAVDSDFPLTGRSALVSVANQWAPQPTAFFVGGKTVAGTTSGATWAFDGSRWATIDDSSLPDMAGVTLVKYVIFRNTMHVFHQVAYEAWFAIGGRLADGSYNRVLYYSLDNGVTWLPASQLMQLPDYFPELYGADGIVSDSRLTADLDKIWSSKPAKAPGRWYKPAYEVDGNLISWECPYIYIIGGTLPDGTLSDIVWRGVMTRLAFTPLI